MKRCNIAEICNLHVIYGFILTVKNIWNNQDCGIVGMLLHSFSYSLNKMKWFWLIKIWKQIVPKYLFHASLYIGTTSLVANERNRHGIFNCNIATKSIIGGQRSYKTHFFKVTFSFSKGSPFLFCSNMLCYAIRIRKQQFHVVFCSIV